MHSKTCFRRGFLEYGPSSSLELGYCKEASSTNRYNSERLIIAILGAQIPKSRLLIAILIAFLTAI